MKRPCEEVMRSTIFTERENDSGQVQYSPLQQDDIQTGLAKTRVLSEGRRASTVVEIAAIPELSAGEEEETIGQPQETGTNEQNNQTTRENCCSFCSGLNRCQTVFENLSILTKPEVTTKHRAEPTKANKIRWRKQKTKVKDTERQEAIKNQPDDSFTQDREERKQKQ